MGYIVPFLTISSILIDVCFTNLIFTGAIFNSYNYWYLLSYSNQFTLHYSILFLIISIIIIPLIYCYSFWYNSSSIGIPLHANYCSLFSLIPFCFYLYIVDPYSDPIIYIILWSFILNWYLFSSPSVFLYSLLKA